MKKGLIIGAVIVVGLFLYSFSIYNRMVTSSEAVDGQWAQVETQYQRRFDLIPNLVESVKGIFEQEKSVFGLIAEARTKYAGAVASGTVAEKVAATNQVESALARLLVVVENYPELRSSESVQTLMAQLEGTENRVSVERKRFNDQVRDYNVLIKRFPASVLARMYGFDVKIYFESVSGAETAPKVEF
ncbi:MAG: LemA family protein [Patescibacteria group bacterium]|jgi:LemA protein